MDYRGMPTPFAFDSEGYTRALERRLCGLCGKPFDYWVFFIGGFGQDIRGFFKGPAHHNDCAKYAVLTLATTKREGIWLFRSRGYTIMKWPEKNEVACHAGNVRGMERIT